MAGILKGIMRQTKIGTFLLGHENVDLFVIPESSCGAFYFAPDKTSKARIKIGLNTPEWQIVVSLLLHETMEFLILRAQHGYRSIDAMCDNTQDRLFVFTHTQFDKLCDRQALFVTAALPELSKIWKQVNEKRERQIRNHRRNA